MAADIENLVARVTNMHLDGLPDYHFGHPNAGEGDFDYWQAVDDLAHHPRFNDSQIFTRFYIYSGCRNSWNRW